jgi:hypothetical protein
MEFNLLTPQSSNTTQAQIDAYRLLQQQQEQGLSGFGQSNVTVDVSTSPTQPDNFWGYWIKPDGSVVDTRKVEKTSWLNKVMTTATPIIMTAAATVVGGPVFGGITGATISGASGEKIALAAILAYMGGKAMGYLKSAYATATGTSGAVLDGLSSADVIAKCQEAGMTGEEISGFLQEAAESGGIDLSEATISKALTEAIPEVVKDVGSEVVKDAVSETAETATGIGEEAASGLTKDPTWTDKLTTAAKVATGAGAVGEAANLASMDAGAASATDSSLGTLGNAGGTTLTEDQVKDLGLSAADLVKLGITVLPVAGSVVNALAGGNEGETLSASTTTDTRPAYIKDDAETLWNEFIDDFYGTSGGTSVKDRETETAAYKSAADATYLADTQTAMKPYQTLMTDLLSQASSGTGYYTPLNLTTSKGGVSSPLVSFVPKQNKDTATQVLGISKTSADTSALLAELQNQLALRNLPNAAADSYSSKLSDLMKYANTGGSTTTETGETAGTNSWAAILDAVNTAANIYGKFSGYQSTTDDLLKKLTDKLSS